MPIVGDGDCAVSIADQLGSRDYHTIWDDGANSALKGTRPNANQLVKGDAIQPAAKGKKVDKAVDSTYTFVLKTRKLPKVSIVIVDKEDKPLSGKPWRITSPQAASGTTDATGKIEIPNIDPQAKSGTLQVDWRKTPAATPATTPPDPVITTPVYPRAIKVSEFKDTKPAAPPVSDDTIEWSVKIGSMPSFNDVSGVQARLNNLGFRCDPDAKTVSTTDDVKTYQRTRLKSATPSGVPADIQDDIRNRHDNP